MPRARKRKAPAANSENSSTISDAPISTRSNGDAGKKKNGSGSKVKAGSVAGPRQSTRKNAGGRLKEFTSAASGKRRSAAVPSVKKRKPWEESDEEEGERSRGARRVQVKAVSSSSDDDNESEFEDKDEDEDSEKSESTSSDSESAEYEDESRAPSHSRDTITPAKDEPNVNEGVFCPWIELAEGEIPQLQLPHSSTDLLIDKSHLLCTLEVYEILRNFHRVVQLSPFIFEDFCAALRSPTQSKLLCEIHLALIRLLFRDDEEDQTIFSVIDTSGSFNILLQLLEPMTFAEVLRQYMESDNRVIENGREALRIVQHTNYPFVGMGERLTVLKWLCERLFETVTFKKLMKNDGKITYDEHCRDCGKQGNVLLCDGCEACYHLRCAGEDESPPDGLWFCKICRLHQVKGATACHPPGQKDAKVKPLSIRLQSLGHDRHGRMYWFVARRVFVQDEKGGEVFYYSTLPQLFELLSALDPQRYERRLCNQLMQVLSNIALDMHLTLEVTDERRVNLQTKIKREPAEPYFHIDNAYRMAKILASCKSNQKRRKNADEEEGVAPILEQTLKLLCVVDGHLTESFWTGGMDEKDLLQYQRDLEKETAAAKKCDSIEGLHLLDEYQQKSERGYRLGFSGGDYRAYTNHYSANDFAKSPYVRAKERDKRKYMCSRFSLADEGEFNWATPNSCFSNESDVGKCIQASLRQLVDKIPDELMHRLWRSGEKAKFLETLSQAEAVCDLKYLLLQFERAARKPIFLSVWWNSLGHIKLIRITAEDRENKQKTDQSKKKEEKVKADRHNTTTTAADTVDDNMVWVNFRGAAPKHNLWRQKDEQYRINGKGALGGWMWFSRTAKRRYVVELKKPPRLITSATPSNQITTPEARRAQRLDRLAKRLISWRLVDELTTIGRQQRESGGTECYSPTCQLITSGRQAALKVIPFVGVSGELQSRCYSPSCPRSGSNYGRPTTGIVKAFRPYSGNNPYDIAQVSRQRPFREVLGLGRTFPFPKPFEYKSRPGAQSNLLTLPQWSAKKLARQGGLQPTNMHGFNRAAKSNPQLWSYPCARPLFDNCWRFSTLQAHSLHAVALRLRVLYACIRWSDMEPDPDEPDTRVWVHQPDNDEVRWVIGHRENPPDGYYEQYRIRVQQYQLDDNAEYGDDDEDDDHDHSEYRGHGSRARGKGKRKSNAAASFSAKKALMRRKAGAPHDRWMDGVDLKLWEIATYWHRYFNRPPPGSIILQPVNNVAQQGTPRGYLPRNHHPPVTQNGTGYAHGGYTHPSPYTGPTSRVLVASDGSARGYGHQLQQTMVGTPAGHYRLQPVRNALVAAQQHYQTITANSTPAFPQLRAPAPSAGGGATTSYRVICSVPTPTPSNHYGGAT